MSPAAARGSMRACAWPRVNKALVQSAPVMNRQARCLNLDQSHPSPDAMLWNLVLRSYSDEQHKITAHVRDDRSSCQPTASMFTAWEAACLDCDHRAFHKRTAKQLVPSAWLYIRDVFRPCTGGACSIGAELCACSRAKYGDNFAWQWLAVRMRA